MSTTIYLLKKIKGWQICGLYFIREDDGRMGNSRIFELYMSYP